MIEDENKYLIEEGSVIKKQPPVLDCVSRQAVINILNKPVIIKAKKRIKKLPIIQPENDIQYCKDCPEVQHEETLGYLFCVHRAVTERIVQPDDYCSYPKRKKDGKEGV